MRFILAIVAVLNAAATSAQDAKESVPPTIPSPAKDESKIVYELEVSPADEPRPAMKYRLLPNPADLQPGNAATQYYKAFVLDATAPTSRKEFSQLWEKYAEVPLRNVDVQELGKALEPFNERVFYDSIRAATFRSFCDWEQPVEEQGVHVLLPAVQTARSTCVLLTIKAKYEIARGDYNAAIATARDAFTLGYHMQQNGEVLVQALVGVAIVGLVHDNFILEWLQSPNSPNLYWALSEIPPYFDTRGVLASDLRIPEYTFPGLQDLDKRAFGADEANNLAARAFAVEKGPRFDSLHEDDIQGRAGLAAWVLQAYEESYRELSDSGISSEMLDRMPAAQVALLARWKRYQVLRDDLYKWWLLLHGDGRDLAMQRYDTVAYRRELISSLAPFDQIVPHLSGLFRAQLRQHRYLSALRTIEALRMYAGRQGDFPDALTDIRDVPVPDDPVTNAPFIYRASAKTATLTMVRHRLGADMEYEYRLRLREPNIPK